jgi:hypothetical protein
LLKFSYYLYHHAANNLQSSEHDRSILHHCITPQVSIPEENNGFDVYQRTLLLYHHETTLLFTALKPEGNSGAYCILGATAEALTAATHVSVSKNTATMFSRVYCAVSFCDLNANE